MSRLKKYVPMLQNWSLLLATLLILFFIGEISVRLVGWCPRNLQPDVYQESSIPGLEFEMRPGLHHPGFGCETVTTNSKGFRSPEIVEGKPIIAFLGDSFTFGFGIEDDQTNPLVFQKHFPQYQIMNTGVNGYTIDQEVLTYENKVAPWKPKLVVLEFVTNDADKKASFAQLYNGRVHHSALREFLSRRIQQLYGEYPTTLVADEWNDKQFVFYNEWFVRLSKDIGKTPKLFVIWPDVEVHPKTIEKVSQLATRNGWSVFDLSQLFGVHYGRLRWDPHPNAKTQRLAGDAIASFVTKYLPLEP
jgi:lysophospholipase L1-like esterase